MEHSNKINLESWRRFRKDLLSGSAWEAWKAQMIILGQHIFRSMQGINDSTLDLFILY